MKGQSGSICKVCGLPIPARTGAGRPGEFDDEGCKRCAELVSLLKKSLPTRPGMLIYILEQLEQVDVDRSLLSDGDVRRIRAAAFTLASKGRRLAPGTSGRYPKRKTKKVKPDPILTLGDKLIALQFDGTGESVKEELADGFKGWPGGRSEYLSAVLRDIAKDRGDFAETKADHRVYDKAAKLVREALSYVP